MRTISIAAVLSISLAGPLFADITFNKIPIATPRTVNPQAVAIGPDAPIPNITFREIPTPNPPTYIPNIIAEGPGGSIWFVNVFIGTVTLDGAVTMFPVKPADADSAQGIRLTMGPDGNMWFTALITRGASRQPVIGRSTPTGSLTYFPIPTATATNGLPSCDPVSNQCDITRGPDGNVWFILSRSDVVGRITPSGSITEFPVTPTGGILQRITSGPDGNLWVTNSISNRILRVTPNGVVTVFSVTPNRSSIFFYGITGGPDGNVYFTETGNTGGNRIGRITPSGVITEFPIPTPNARPDSIVTGPDGQIWFTEDTAMKIGRLQISNPPGGFSASAPGDIDESATPRNLRPQSIINAGGRLVFNAVEFGSGGGFDFRLFAIETGAPACSITCPPNIVTVAAEGETGARVNFGASLQNCPPDTMVFFDPFPNSIFPIGTTTVTATTSAGPSCSFTVTVTAPIKIAFDSSGNFKYAPEAGHPVNTATGELYEQLAPDLYLGGPLPLLFSRYYASLLSRDNNVTSALGTNWSHNFDWKVKSLTPDNSRIGVVDSRGRLHQFLLMGNSYVLASPTDIPVQFVVTQSGGVFADPITERVYTFNLSGQLTRIDDSHGNALTLTYSGNNLSQVSDGLGRTLTFAYDSSNHLTSVSDGTRSIRFTYSGSDLATAVDALGKTTTYAYDGSGRLTSTTLPRGNVQYAQTFDSSGRVATQTAGGSNTTSFAYGTGSTTITDAASIVRTQDYNPSGAREELSFTDESNDTVALGYDGSTRRNSVTDRLGDMTRVTHHAPSGKVAEVINAEEGRTTFSYGARSFTGVTLYPLTRVTYADNTTETYTYDGNGNRLSRTDRAGKRSTFTYNNRGQVLTATSPTSGVVTFTYNGDGTPASSRDSEIGATSYGYDSLKRLNRMTRADGTAVQIEYDANDRITAVTDELGRRFTNGYDANDNLTQVTDPASKTLQLAYDALDRITESTNRVGGVTRLTYNNRELPATATDANNNQVTLGYDARKRLSSVSDAAGKSWSLGYDDEGMPSSMTNPLNQTFTSTTNRLGIVTSLRNPLGQQWTLTRDAVQRVTSITDPLSRFTTMAYDARGLLTSVNRPVIGTAQYQRNDLGLISSIRDLNGQSWQRNYSAEGRLQSTRDPLGRSTTFTYDSRGRISVVGFPDAVNVNNAFDAVGNLTRANISGGPDLQYVYDALNRVTSASGTIITYDDEGRPTSTNSGAGTFGAQYDGAGRLKSVSYNNGAFSVTYTYDSRDLVTRVTDSQTNTQINLTYDDARRLVGLSRPNGLNTTYAYDAAGRLRRIQEGAIVDLNYTIDAVGQVTNENGTRPLDPQALTLPNLDSTFAHDNASQIAGPGFAHDARGRVVSGNGHTFNWDGASRLTRIDATTFEYDGFGQLLRRGVTSYSYNVALGVNTIVSDGARSYIRLPGGALLYAIEGSSVIHYHFDRAGSTIALTNSSGSVTDAYAYDPYGTVIARQGSSAQPFTYIGRFGVRAEPAANVYQMGARYYDPSTARFLSKDPGASIAPHALNPYQYAAQNPVRYIDPPGLQPFDSSSLSFQPYVLPPVDYGLPGLISLDLNPPAKPQEWAFGDDGTAFRVRDSVSASAPSAIEVDPALEWETISPRIGLTYALGGERQTLLRAAYNRYVEQLGDSASGSLSVPSIYTYGSFYTFDNGSVPPIIGNREAPDKFFNNAAIPVGGDGVVSPDNLGFFGPGASTGISQTVDADALQIPVSVGFQNPPARSESPQNLAPDIRGLFGIDLGGGVFLPFGFLNLSGKGSSADFRDLTIFATWHN